MLADMPLHIIYSKFKALKEAGLRDQANEFANIIVVEWGRTKDILFARQIANDAIDGKINQRLFRGILYPIIESGLEHNDKNAFIMAIKCVQNIYADKLVYKKLNYITEIQLLKRLIDADPANEWARIKYIDAITNWIKYCIHEWPTGILYGSDGATMDECDDIIVTIDETSKMDIECRYANLLCDAKSKTILYKQRLS